MVPVWRAHIPAIEIIRRHAVGRVALHIDPLDPVAVDEIVDKGSAPGRRKGGVDVGGRNPQRIGLCLIDIDMKLLGVVQAVGPHAREQGILRRQAQQHVAGLDQLLMAQIAAILHLQIEAGGDPSSGTEGGTSGNTWASGRRMKLTKARRAIAWALFWRRALAPILQAGESDAGILADADEAETGDGKDELDVLLFLGEIVSSEPARPHSASWAVRCRTAC